MKLKAGKIFSAICMVLSVMLAASVLVAAQGTEVYINSAYDLKKLAEDVNAGNDYAGVTVILQSDIKSNYCRFA